MISNKSKKDIKSGVLSVHYSELKGSNLEEIRTFQLLDLNYSFVLLYSFYLYFVFLCPFIRTEKAMVVINDCAIGVIMMRSILEGKNYVEYAISLWDRRLQETVKMLIN